jgi:hypothetical protein
MKVAFLLAVCGNKAAASAEWRVGTKPTNANSVFRFSMQVYDDSTEMLRRKTANGGFRAMSGLFCAMNGSVSA